LELVDEITIRHSQYPGWILAHDSCSDDQAPLGKLWAQAPGESEAYQCPRREATDKEASAFGGACAADAGLYGNKLSYRGHVPVDSEGVRLRSLTMIDTNKSCGELARQGNDQANATQPDTLLVSAAR
jgi:hypothetical protein